MTAKPTYKARNAHYEIDRCEPQNRAIETGKIDFHALTKDIIRARPCRKIFCQG